MSERQIDQTSNPEPGWGAQVRVLVLDAPNAVVSVYDQDGNFIPASVVIRSSDNADQPTTVVPDREALSNALHRIGRASEQAAELGKPWSFDQAADALIASGVLGVSADLIRAETTDDLMLAFFERFKATGSVSTYVIRQWWHERAAEYRKKVQ